MRKHTMVKVWRNGSLRLRQMLGRINICPLSDVHLRMYQRKGIIFAVYQGDVAAGMVT